MKFLAIADQQLGVAGVTLESQEAVWDQAVTLVIENEVAGVLHAGDLFEHAIVEGQVLAAFRRPLGRLRDAEIPMLLIRGNHDGAVRPVDALDVFHEYPLLTVSQRPELIPFAGAFVVTLPWVSPKHLVASSNGASRDNIYEATAEHLVGIARDLLSNVIDGPTILMLHWSVSGASLPTGLPVDQLRDVILPWPELEALGFDAIVAGHIHKPQALGPHGFYCGSPQPLNHGEEGVHGVWIVDIGAGTSTQDFVGLDAPQFVTHDVDPDLLAANPFWPNIAQGDIVRVRYTATREEDARIDKEAIRRAILDEGASRVTIEPNIIREARARVENLTGSLTELNALMAYCQAQQIPEELFERMHARTEEWL